MVDRNLKKTSNVDRLVCIGRISDAIQDKYKHFTAYYQKVFKQVKSAEGDTISGILLIVNKYFVHIIEGSTSLIMSVVKDLNSSKFMQDVRIILATQGVPCALYPIWSCRELQTGFKPNEYESSDPPEVVAGEVVTNLLKLGKFIATKPKHDLKTTLDNLKDKVPELLPQQEIVEYLIKDVAIMPAADYLHLYTNSAIEPLDSELVWPIAGHIFPYN